MRRSAAGGMRCGGVLLGLLLACLVLTAAGATTRVTELEQSLAGAPAADKSRLLAELSAEIEPEDMNRAWDLAQQARREALNPADEIRADTRLAALMRRRGSYAEALALGERALAQATALQNKPLRAEAMLIVANTHDSLADFPAALDLFRTLTPLAEEIGDSRFLARVYNTLGTTYADADQPDRARQTYETGIGYATKANDQRLIASILNNLGNLAMDAGDGPHARAYHEKALALRESTGGDTRGIADSNQNLAEVALVEHNPAAALPYLDRAIALHTALGLNAILPTPTCHTPRPSGSSAGSTKFRPTCTRRCNTPRNSRARPSSRGSTALSPSIMRPGAISGPPWISSASWPPRPMRPSASARASGSTPSRPVTMPSAASMRSTSCDATGRCNRPNSPPFAGSATAWG
ncbi:MAG: tetratricopeptide repeat protein [Lacunisphaera sp.]